MEMTLYAVEVQLTATFSARLAAHSPEDAENEAKRRISQLKPESVVCDARAWPQVDCEGCGTVHFGPPCMKRAGDILRRIAGEAA